MQVKCKICGKRFFANKATRCICGTECHAQLARDRHKIYKNKMKRIDLNQFDINY